MAARLLTLILLVALNHNRAAAVEPLNTLAWQLNGTTWCFEDSEGPWDHGRIAFKTELFSSNTAFYDVTDAPGPGGIIMNWNTYWGFSGWTIKLTYGQDTSYRKIVAHVSKSGDQMTWTFKTDEGRVSILNRCQPALE